MKIEFEKTFGEGVDPWYAKAERWLRRNLKTHTPTSCIRFRCLVEKDMDRG